MYHLCLDLRDSSKTTYKNLIYSLLASQYSAVWRYYNFLVQINIVSSFLLSIYLFIKEAVSIGFIGSSECMFKILIDIAKLSSKNVALFYKFTVNEKASFYTVRHSRF